MVNKKLTLTIVIPVYNEEHYLKACLDSITAQTVGPDEVIVVDNNSTDHSMEIAKRYKFVRILQEKRQHQVFAQSKGFNAASSDLIGRVDADSILPTDWVEKIKQVFQDSSIVAITGGAEPYDVPLKLIGTTIFYSYNFLYSLIAGARMLFGGNCAVRKDAWDSIRESLFYRPDIWEDYDMSFCLKDLGRLKYVSHMVVGVSFRAAHKPFLKQVNYQFRVVRTFYLRTNLLKTILVALVWVTLLCFFPLTVIDKWLLGRREHYS